LFKRFIYMGLVASSVWVLTLLFFLLQSSWAFWHQIGVQVLWQDEWYPYEHLYGFLPAIVGTLWALCIAMLIAVPCALAAAIVNSELVPRQVQPWGRVLMEILAGVPSIVYGLLGLWVLLPFLQKHLNLLSGHSLLAAGMMLSLMVLPTMMLMAEDALRAVPLEQREAGMHLGLNWEQRLWRILLPQAYPGMRSGMILSLGRALGETMAVMLVVGSMDRMPEPLYNILQPAQTLTSRIGREIGEASFGSLHFSALMACGVVLAAMALLLGRLAQGRAR